MKIKFWIILFCTNFQFVLGQTSWKDLDKSIFLCPGINHIPIFHDTPVPLGFLSKNTGPSIMAGLDLANKTISSHQCYLRYGLMGAVKDTIIVPAAIPSDISKIYNIQGKTNFAAMGYSWKRYFFNNERFRPFVFFGGELLVQYREVHTALYYFGFDNTTYLFTESSFSGLFVSARTGLGISHQLTERLLLMEQIEIGTPLFHNYGNGFRFTPELDGTIEWLVQASVGISYKLK